MRQRNYVKEINHSLTSNIVFATALRCYELLLFYDDVLIEII